MIYVILLSAAALLVVFIAAVLIILWAVPVTLTGRASLRQDAPTLIFTFCARWGIVTLHANIPEETDITISLFGRKVRHIQTGTEQAEPPEEEKTEEEEEKAAPDVIGIADAVLPQAGPLLHQISIDPLCASVRFGLGDPALTGEVFGILMAIRGMLMATGGKVSLAAEAEFDDRIVEGEANGAIRIAHPLSLVPPVIRIIRHPAVWKMVRSA